MGWTQAMVLGLAQIVRERLAVLTNLICASAGPDGVLSPARARTAGCPGGLERVQSGRETCQSYATKGPAARSRHVARRLTREFGQARERAALTDFQEIERLGLAFPRRMRAAGARALPNSTRVHGRGSYSALETARVGCGHAEIGAFNLNSNGGFVVM
jgi:hypothetical protein